MNRVRVVPFVWMCSALVLASCGGDDKKLELGGSCSLNSDCVDGLLCKFGACHKACVKSVDCATGERCVQVDGIAVCQMVSEGSCDRYGNCQSPLSCRAIDNTCRNKCPTGNECLPGQVCSATFCIESTEVVAFPDASVLGPDAAPAPDSATTIPDAAADRPQTPDASAGPEAERPIEAGGPQNCMDDDGDGYGEGAGCRGKDCDDTAPFCTDSCVDADKNGIYDCAEYWFAEAPRDIAWQRFLAKSGNYLFIAGTNQAGFGGNDIQLTEMTTEGQVLHQTIIGSSQDENLQTGVAQLQDGSLLVHGSWGSDTKLFFMRVGQDGAVLASKTVSTGHVNDHTDFALALPNGNVLVSGYFGGSADIDSWIGELAVDSMSFLWQTRLSDLGINGNIYSMVLLSDGDVVAARQTQNSGQLIRLGPKGEIRWARAGLPWRTRIALTPNDGNLVLVAIGPNQPFTVAKLTPAGDVLWYKTASGKGGAVANDWSAITADVDGSIVAYGSGNYRNPSGNSWLTKLTSDGQVLWTYSTGKYAPSNDLYFESDGSLLLLANTAVGRIPSDPSKSCVLTPQQDAPQSGTANLTAISPKATSITPWALVDYPVQAMVSTVKLLQVCPIR
jgi:hypothetical protein